MRGDKEKITIRLYSGDRERIQRFFPGLPYQQALREIVKAHLDKIQARYEKDIAERHPAPKIGGE